MHPITGPGWDHQMVQMQCGPGKELGSFLFSNSNVLSEVGKNKENLVYMRRLESVFSDWQTTLTAKHFYLSQHRQTIKWQDGIWEQKLPDAFFQGGISSDSSQCKHNSQEMRGGYSPGIDIVPVSLPFTSSTANFPYG